MFDSGILTKRGDQAARSKEEKDVARRNADNIFHIYREQSIGAGHSDAKNEPCEISGNERKMIFKSFRGLIYFFCANYFSLCFGKEYNKTEYFKTKEERNNVAQL